MIFPDLPFAEYRDHPAYGSSDLRAFKIGPPAMVPWRRANRNHNTDATRIGKAAHCHILTPDLFDADYWVKPEGMEFRSAENKAIRDSQLASGKEILTHEEYEQIQQIVEAFEEKHDLFKTFRRALGVENSVFWDGEGLPCKGRPDWFDAHAVYDLKISVDAEKAGERLAFKAWANGWLNQLAHNRTGLNANGHAIKVGRLVVIAPTPPQSFRVHLLEVRENDMDFLELDNANTRRGMLQCHRSGVWPGTPDQWTTIELPASAAFTEADIANAEDGDNPLI